MEENILDDFGLNETIWEQTFQVSRLENGMTITNEFMYELHKSFKSSGKTFLVFHEVLRNLVPHDIYEDFSRMGMETLRSRVEKFVKRARNAKKTKSVFQKLMLEDFDLTVNKATPDTPRKRKLKQDLLEHKRVIKKLKVDSDHFESEVSRLKDDVNQTEKEKESLETERNKFKMKAAGLKSGQVRHKCISPSTSAESAPLKGKTASTGTEIEGLLGDLVLLSLEEKPGLYEGRRYFKCDVADGRSKLSTGSNAYYAEIPKCKEPASKINKKEVQKRGRFAMDVLGKISSPHNDESEKELVLTEMIKSNKELFIRAAENAGVSTLRMLTPEQAVNIRSLMRLPMNKVRNLRSCLSNLKVNIFPSERKMRNFQRPLTSHVNAMSVETGFMGLHKTAADEMVTSRPYVRVKDLESYISEFLQSETLIENDQFNGRLWLLFGGDKGGQHMKFHVECLNTSKAGSVDNVHIFCMFEAADTLDNMWKVFYPFRQQINDLQQPGKTILGKKLEIFLGGDYHFLDDCLGHQGSSASFPSSSDLVQLQHLQTHGGMPHTPESCPTSIRSVKHYAESYNENLSDSRNGYNRRENGKYHYSVIEQMLFPIKSLDRVVPPGLHIMLGIMLNIYNLILDECRRIDEKEKESKNEEHQQEISYEWELKSIELEDKTRKLREIGEEVVEIENRCARIESVVAGDPKKNLELSKVSDTGRKSKKRAAIEKCSSAYCCITHHDANVQWVQCDKCEMWFHTFCECMSAQEELTISDTEVYECLSCSKVDVTEDFDKILNEKVAKLIEEEDQVKTDTVKLQAECDSFRSKFDSVVGEREKRLSDSLDQMGVIRQSYHGNVFVGNHCKKILQNFHLLTEVVRDQEEMFNNFNEIFTIFRDIQRLMSANRFLTFDEIEKLNDLCINFGNRFPVLFPNRNLTRKMHELIFTVPRFVRKFKTLGKLSEEEGESLHAAVNQELRQLACVRDQSEKIRLVLERQELRSSVSKLLLKVDIRICQRCKLNGNRRFLRKGRDNEKHCPACSRDKF